MLITTFTAHVRLFSKSVDAKPPKGMDLLKITITILLLLVCALSAVQVIDKLQDDATYRLPNSSYPESYVITLIFGNFNRDDSPSLAFTGSVTIDIKILEDTEEIVLHSSVAEITEHTLTVNEAVVEYDLSNDTERELLILTSRDTLVKDSRVSLWIKFIGNIGSAIRGVYRASYLTENSERR